VPICGRCEAGMRNQALLTGIGRPDTLIVVSLRGSTKATPNIRANGWGGLLHVPRIVRSHVFPGSLWVAEGQSLGGSGMGDHPHAVHSQLESCIRGTVALS
jgi:hypothetical protein